MEFFLEMLFTLLIAFLLFFPVAKLVSAGNSGGGGNDTISDQAHSPEIGVGDVDFFTEELTFGLKMDARVLQNERNFLVVDENVEPVDRFGNEADRVDEFLEAATVNGKFRDKGEELAALTAESESMAAISPDNVIAEEIIVRELDDRRYFAEELDVYIGAEPVELMVRVTEAESTASVSPENVVAEERMVVGQEELSESTERISACQENEESGDILLGESEEVRVEESNSAEESKMEGSANEDKEEKEELSIEEDDDWEGIERSELEKSFAAASKFLEESGKAEEISDDAKMELYGLHKIATEGSCREAQPMVVMVSARAKWNAWQKLGNMSQEEAMEQYLALISKEIPGFMSSGHTVGKMQEMESSVVLLPPNSGSLEDPTTLKTTGVEPSKNGQTNSLKISGER